MASSSPAPKDHYKVRVVFPGVLIHLASWSEPQCTATRYEPKADWITEADYGDTIGYIDWTAVVAITWRFHAGADT